jgi:quercetin dioxygenase-like cupin family protein
MSLAYMAGTHERLEWMGNSTIELLLDADATEGQVFMSRTSLLAGDASPVHLHTKEDEIFLVLEGSAIFWFGEERYDLETGGVVYLPRNVPHAYRMTADTELLTICTPAGVEKFFRAAGHDLSTPKPSNWEITPATVAAATEGTGVQILGPPPSA